MLLRLKSRAQFQAVLTGQTVSRTPHFALHRQYFAAVAASAGWRLPRQDEAEPAFVGAMTPKRWARRAVTRNSIKRQIYQVSADIETRLTGAAYVVRLRRAFDRAQFPSATSDALKRAVRSELQQLFDQLPVAPPMAAR